MKEFNINVLIAEDDEHSLNQSRKKIELYVPADRILTARDSGEILWIIQNKSIDLAFLDMELPDTDGFSVADYLKECQPEAKFVFLTGHVELGAKSYDYEPLDFLCKPVDAMRLQKTFQRFARSRQVPKPVKEKIAIEATVGFIMVYPDEISYITRESRKSVIYCKEQSYIAKGSLDELELIFSDYGFFRCHQSYLAPLRRIVRVIQSEFGRAFWAVLDTEDKIPVSRGKYAALRNAIAEMGTRFV